jgi:hypothetical protein
MGKIPLEVLKAGLTQLKKHIKACKETLSACLFNKYCISEEDKHWLDNEANLVDKDVVVDRPFRGMLPTSINLLHVSWRSSSQAAVIRHT